MSPQARFGRRTQPVPPFVWLAIGVTLLALSNGRWIVPLATWLGPVCWLRFLDSTHRRTGLLAVLASSLLLWPFCWQGMIPAPGWLYFMVTTIYAGVYFLPFVAHRLLASESTAFASSLVFPTAWIGVDLLFQRFVSPYGSWTSLAYTQIDFLALTQFASIVGGFGITFLITWFAGTLAWLWRAGFTLPRLRLAAVAYGVPWVAIIAFGVIRLSAVPSPGPLVRVAAIIPSEELETQFSRAFYGALAAGNLDEASNGELLSAASRLNADLMARTQQAASEGLDLVAWSETAARVTPAGATDLVTRGQELVDSYGIVLALAYGTWDPEATPPLANMLTILRPGVAASVHYHKARPIVGAETPFTGEGSPAVAVVETADFRLGAAICHDLDFPRLIRDAGRAQVQLMVAPSADWSVIESMHAAMAKLRAVENGFTLLRPTAGGRTLAVDTRGRESTWMERDGFLVTNIAASNVETVYARIGDLCAWLCLGGFFFLAARSWRVRSLERRLPVARDTSNPMRRPSGLLLVLASLSAAASAEALLEIEIDCIRSAEGEVRIALFDSSETHLKTAIRSDVLAVAEDGLVWRAHGLPARDYSVAVFHDRNGNGRLDRRLFGLPAEPYGFSNGVRVRFGPPSWRSARFRVEKPATKISICVK